jgi:hypothetical protein
MSLFHVEAIPVSSDYFLQKKLIINHYLINKYNKQVDCSS